MAEKKTTPCKFHLPPKGCNKGANCDYGHIDGKAAVAVDFASVGLIKEVRFADQIWPLTKTYVIDEPTRRCARHRSAGP